MRNVRFSIVVFSLFIACLVVLSAGGKNCSECYEPPAMAGRAIVCGLLIMIGAIASKIHYFRVETTMSALESLPLLEPHEATDGVPFAGEAVIKPHATIPLLTSPFTGTPCVYFHSITERLVQSGKNKHWKVVANVSSFIPFILQDQIGDLDVDLTNIDTDLSAYHIDQRSKDIPDPRHSEIDSVPVLKHAPVPIFNAAAFIRTSSVRYSEYVLMPDMKVFAYGMVSDRNGRHVLHEHEQARLIISQKTRDQYVQSFYQGNAFVYGTHVLLASGFTVALMAVNHFLHLTTSSLYTLVIGGNVLLIGSVVFTMYNRIVTLYERTDNALADIEAELKRRHDLIPNLVTVVKAYTSYEKEVLEFTTALRAELSFMPYEPQGTSAISTTVAALVERYPKLKADANFIQLMQELVDTEERIAYSREFYNRTVRKYNILVNQFPFLLIARPFSYASRSFLQIERGTAVPPVVQI